VRLPWGRVAGVTEGGQPLEGREGIASSRQEGDGVVVEVGSGTYQFVVNP
jgi:hypothetical protein